jgi:MFS superfamily sulfate permease-like transporter
VDLENNVGAEPIPGVLIVRFDGPLVFASVDTVVEDLRRRALRPEERPGVVVLDLEAAYEAGRRRAGVWPGPRVVNG